MMTASRTFLILIFVLFLLFAISCSPRIDTDWHFTGKIVDLFILESDLPAGWKLEDIGKGAIPNAESAFVIYDAAPDTFATNSLIAHHIIVFDEVEEATRYLQTEYQIELELTRKIATSMGIQQEDFTPPQKYAYTSPVANEFQIIYSPEENFAGLVGYKYEVWARYGNVVSWFVTIVEDEEVTGVTAKAANVVPWSEVERLLKIIDERFQEAANKP